MKLSVLMPIYNEAKTLAEAVSRVQGVDVPKEIILIDDGSTDGTREILTRLETAAKEDADPNNQVKVVFKSINQGKGSAIRSGLAQVTGDMIIIQDADLEYDPQDYPMLLDPILSGAADVVYGTRFYGGGPPQPLRRPLRSVHS